MLRVGKGGLETLWANDESLSNHFSTSVYHEGHLYGFHGRQERSPDFRCVDLATKKVAWEKQRYGCGSLILADGKLVVLTERGDLVLVEATPAAYRERARAHGFDAAPCRAQIALAGGRLYGRDQKKLICFNLVK